jgi:hypothetical protein
MNDEEDVCLAFGGSADASIWHFAHRDLDTAAALLAKVTDQRLVTAAARHVNAMTLGPGDVWTFREWYANYPSEWEDLDGMMRGLTYSISDKQTGQLASLGYRVAAATGMMLWDEFTHAAEARMLVSGSAIFGRSAPVAIGTRTSEFLQDAEVDYPVGSRFEADGGWWTRVGTTGRWPLWRHDATGLRVNDLTPRCFEAQLREFCPYPWQGVSLTDLGLWSDREIVGMPICDMC